MSKAPATTQILAHEEYEFSTLEIIRIGTTFYRRFSNGGERGAWDKPKKGQFSTMIISREEAAAELLKLDLDPEKVAELTQPPTWPIE